MNFHKTFLKAIEHKLLVYITFDTLEKGIITRQCIPYDYAPSKRDARKEYKYQVFDLDNNHNLAISPNPIIGIRLASEGFDPEAIVTWKPNWFYSRNWGSKS